MNLLFVATISFMLELVVKRFMVAPFTQSPYNLQYNNAYYVVEKPEPTLIEKIVAGYSFINDEIDVFWAELSFLERLILILIILVLRLLHTSAFFTFYVLLFIFLVRK